MALSILESAKQRNTRFHSLSSFACANFGLCRYDYKEGETGQNVVQKFYECDKPTQKVGEVCMRLQLHWRKQRSETMMGT